MSPVEHAELSDLERQVARLVAWGGSNRDVAEALGIEATAVDRHLARVYRKLGIRSEAELPRPHAELRSLSLSESLPPERKLTP
jgi:DNA-binding NarL/FixJ family response regulator